MPCQGGGSIMVLSKIFGSPILNPFQDIDSIKMNAQNVVSTYVHGLLSRATQSDVRILLFQHDNSNFYPEKHDAHWLGNK